MTLNSIETSEKTQMSDIFFDGLDKIVLVLLDFRNLSQY